MNKKYEQFYAGTKINIQKIMDKCVFKGERQIPLVKQPQGTKCKIGNLHDIKNLMIKKKIKCYKYHYSLD